MTYLTCPEDIDFSPVHGLMSMGKGISMKKVCAIDIFFVYISVVFKICLCIVMFISKLVLGMVYKRIIRRLDAEEMNKGLQLFEAGRFQWHVAGALGVSRTLLQGCGESVYERFVPIRVANIDLCRGLSHGVVGY